MEEKAKNLEETKGSPETTKEETKESDPETTKEETKESDPEDPDDFYNLVKKYTSKN